MTSQRFIVGASVLLAVAGLAGCGGITQFAGTQPFAIVGNPPAPPPPPPEEPKAPPRVELRDNKIDFKEKIQFEVNKATIKEESFSLLHDIAEVIRKNPQLKKLSIEGHASSEGDAKVNKKLSEQRAKAVMDHLVKKESIPAAQLASKGWGVEKPIADNASESGREANRRVEFLVVEQDITQKKVEIDAKTGKERVVEEKKELFKSEAPAATDDKSAPAKPATGKPAAATKTAPAPKLPPVKTTPKSAEKK